MKFRATIILESVTSLKTDEESIKEAIKYAMQEAIDNDDNGDEELNYTVRVADDDF